MRIKYCNYLGLHFIPTMRKLHEFKSAGTLSPVAQPRGNGISHFRGTMWGVAVYAKVSAPGIMATEIKTARLFTTLPKISDLVQCYLFVGQVQVSAVIAMLDVAHEKMLESLRRWESHTMVDIIVTKDFGPTLMEFCIADAKTIVSDAELEAKTIRMLVIIFVALRRLRDNAEARHQDAKLDNIVYAPNGAVCFLDFEFAHSQSMPNEEADFVGCGMQPYYCDGSDHFDIHTVVYSLLYFCGGRYRTLPKLEALRATLLGPAWPTPHATKPFRNKSNHCIAYMEAQPEAPCTFEAAISVGRELVRLG